MTARQRIAEEGAAMLNLAGRVEAAAGHDWELNQAIAEALGWKQRPMDWRMTREWEGPDGRLQPGLPDYTASLDAAMTLIPAADWTALELISRQALSAWKATLSRLDDDKNGGEEFAESKRCRSPALAVTAACLRARAAIEALGGEQVLALVPVNRKVIGERE